MKIPNIKEKVIKVCIEEFFKINDLQLGDEVEYEFSYHKLHTKYKSRKLERMTHRTKTKGILNQDERGLYVESLDNFSFYKSDYNLKSGYKHESRKAIERINCGCSFHSLYRKCIYLRFCFSQKLN